MESYAPLLWTDHELTFPTAASPSNTSLTLLLGFGAVAPAASVIEGSLALEGIEGLFARRLRPTLYEDSLLAKDGALTLQWTESRWFPVLEWVCGPEMSVCSYGVGSWLMGNAAMRFTQ